jgi:amino acid transporter
LKWFAQPSIAIVFGAFMLCTETGDDFDAIVRLDWRDMPLYEWTAAGLLIAAGFVRRRDYQAVAWAFMLSLLVGAFFGHLGEWLAPTEPEGWLPERIVLPVLIVLIGFALSALVSTLRARGGRKSS